MKKFLSIFALAAMLLPLACNKDNKTDVVDLNKRIASADETWKFDIEDQEGNDFGSGVGRATGAEKTDGGQLVITTKETVDGEEQTHVFSGTAQKVNEHSFEMVDEKTQQAFAVDIQPALKDALNQQISITYKGKVYVLTATPKGEFSADPVIVAALARRFQILQTTISVQLPENDALAAAHSESGCDLPAIAKYMKDAGGVEFDYDFTGYVVKNIEFSARGTVIIRFTGRDPYEGEMVKLNKAENNKYTFEYDLDVKDSDNNPIFNGNAEGLVDPDFTKGRINLELNAKGSTKDKKEYKAKVQLLLAPIAQ